MRPGVGCQLEHQMSQLISETSDEGKSGTSATARRRNLGGQLRRVTPKRTTLYGGCDGIIVRNRDEGARRADGASDQAHCRHCGASLNGVLMLTQGNVTEEDICT